MQRERERERERVCVCVEYKFQLIFKGLNEPSYKCSCCYNNNDSTRLMAIFQVNPCKPVQNVSMLDFTVAKTDASGSDSWSYI